VGGKGVYGCSGASCTLKFVAEEAAHLVDAIHCPPSLHS
jgi:hypothetical protein